jgi:hypothetical protein
VSAELKPLWQPIETAPRDGTAVLVMRDIWPGTKSGRAEECNGHNTYVAEWWQGENGGAGAWICYMDSICEPKCPVEPTHWMPLPPPPTAQPVPATEREPIARILHWRGPAHYPVPHGGICARTFEEFPKDARKDGYWKEGAPLFLATQATQAERDQVEQKEAGKETAGHRDDYCLLANCRRLLARAYAKSPNWVIAMELFATGSNSARQICINAGIDPDGLKVERAATTNRGEQKP